jgi:YNFM family putative membrane transporter
MARTVAVLQQWTERGTTDYARASFALFLVGFATFSLLYCVQPILPELAAAFSLNPAESSLSLSLTTGFLAFSIFCSGVLAESVGRKGIILFSMLAGAVLNGVAAFAPTWDMFLLARSCEGIVLGGVPAVAMAYLAEEIHPKDLGYAMGLYVGGTAFGGMFGRVVVGLLTGFIGWRNAIGALGAVDFAAAVSFGLTLPPSRHFIRKEKFDVGYHIGAWGGHLAHSGLVMLFALGGLVLGVFVTLLNYMDFRLEAPPFLLSPFWISLIFLSYVFGIFASPLAGSLADRRGRAPVMLCGLLMTAIGIALTVINSLTAVVAGILLCTTGFFTVHSVASGWVGRLAIRDKGHASSLYLLSYYLGSSIFGSLGGLFWARAGWNGVAAYTGVLLALAGCATLLLGVRSAGRRAQG